MNSVEQAIRAALGKGDASDQVFRRRIYGSASAALERSLTARPFTEPEISARRQGLLATIKIIESEFLIAVENEPLPAAVPSPLNDIRTARMLDEMLSQPASASIQAPESRVRQDQRRDPRHDQRHVKIAAPKKPRPWLTYALNIGFLLVLVMGGFWAYAEGKRIYTEAIASKPSGQKPVLSENSNADAASTINWIQIFSARDTDLLSPAQGAKAEITSRDGNNYVVMSGDGSNEVSIKIGSGLVQTFAGKRVLFNIKARSVNSSTLETGAHCNFGADTKCERKRFKIGPQSAEYMFAVAVSASANGDGALFIAPDLTGGGGAVEIESIRATIVEPDAG